MIPWVFSRNRMLRRALAPAARRFPQSQACTRVPSSNVCYQISEMMRHRRKNLTRTPGPVHVHDIIGLVAVVRLPLGLRRRNQLQLSSFYWSAYGRLPLGNRREFRNSYIIYYRAPTGLSYHAQLIKICQNYSNPKFLLRL
jgi:hypothetical protein